MVVIRDATRPISAGSTRSTTGRSSTITSFSTLNPLIWLRVSVGGRGAIGAHLPGGRGRRPCVVVTCTSWYRPKLAYRSSMETTIVVDTDHQGRGLGTALLGALLERLTTQGVHRAVAMTRRSPQRFVGGAPPQAGVSHGGCAHRDRLQTRPPLGHDAHGEIAPGVAAERCRGG